MTGRDDPLGRRALFSRAPPGGADEAAPGAEPGRRAWFSSPAGRQSAPGGVAVDRHVGVECGACGVRTRLGFLNLTRHLIPSLWIPTRRFSRLMRCPNCRRLAWCRLDWWALFGV